jgi:hypothetical protein
LVKLVADAKAAGIHPLYAMGAAGAYQPSLGLSSDTYASAGQSLGRVLTGMDHAKTAQAAVDPLQTAQIHALNSAADRDDAAASASRTDTILQLLKQNSQPSMVTGPLGSYVQDTPHVTASRPGDSSTAAGPSTPALKEATGPFGEKWRMVDQGVGQDMIQPSIMGLESLYKKLIYDQVAPYGRALGKGVFDAQQYIQNLFK